jgi:hypothetical protein
MIRLNPLPNEVAILDQSHVFRGARLILGYVAEHGPIPLTPSKAFKRMFVNWAAEAFVWPHWTVADLYSVNKVLNEYDFGPLEVLYHLLIDLKLGRHYKGTFRRTKVGQGLVKKPKDLFEILVPFFLFNVNHGYYSRFEHEPFRDWGAGLNVLNIEAENGVSPTPSLCHLRNAGPASLGALCQDYRCSPPQFATKHPSQPFPAADCARPCMGGTTCRYTWAIGVKRLRCLALRRPISAGMAFRITQVVFQGRTKSNIHAPAPEKSNRHKNVIINASEIYNPCIWRYRAPPRNKSAARSAIMTTGACVFPEIILGMTEASAIMTFSRPRTRSVGSTTAF